MEFKSLIEAVCAMQSSEHRDTVVSLIERLYGDVLGVIQFGLNNEAPAVEICAKFDVMYNNVQMSERHKAAAETFKQKVDLVQQLYGVHFSPAEIVNAMKRQHVKGVNKYDRSLDDYNPSSKECKRMILEEICDGFAYAEVKKWCKE